VHLRLIDPADRPEAQRILSAVLGANVLLEPEPVALSARLEVDGPEQEVTMQVSRALAELSRAGIAVADFSLGQPSLDEVFLALTGHTADSDTDAEEALA